MESGEGKEGGIWYRKFSDDRRHCNQKFYRKTDLGTKGKGDPSSFLEGQVTYWGVSSFQTTNKARLKRGGLTVPRPQARRKEGNSLLRKKYNML